MVLVQQGFCVVGSGFLFPNHGCSLCSPTSTITSGCTGGLSNTISVTSELHRQSTSTKVCLLGVTRFWPLCSHSCMPSPAGIKWSNEVQLKSPVPGTIGTLTSYPNSSNITFSMGHVKCDVAGCHQ